MKLLRPMFVGWIGFCLATTLAEAGVLAVLWQRGQLNRHTIENLLLVAYDVPLRNMYEELLAKRQPVRQEMVSYSDVQEARMLAALNLDLRDMTADKGLLDLRELDLLVEREKNRYSNMKVDFDERWERIRKDATDNSLQEVRRQIESIHPKLAKDQLLRILQDPQLDPHEALQNVVTIFTSMPIDKRKKIIMEFKDPETAQLQDILRHIRLGKPQADLIREARVDLEKFETEK